jgi:hypothetical protein
MQVKVGLSEQLSVAAVFVATRVQMRERECASAVVRVPPHLLKQQRCVVTSVATECDSEKLKLEHVDYELRV